MNPTDKIRLTVNGEALEVQRGCTIRQLLLELNIKTRAIAVELNDELLPANQFDQQALASNDCLEIVTLVGGG